MRHSVVFNYATLWTVYSLQSFSVIKLSRQEYGVGSYSLLQGIFSTQGWNLGLPHCRRIIYHLDSVDHNKLWKILKEMGIPGYLTCLLRSLHARQEKPTRHGKIDSFKIGRGMQKGCILSSCLFNLRA